MTVRCVDNGYRYSVPGATTPAQTMTDGQYELLKSQVLSGQKFLDIGVEFEQNGVFIRWNGTSFNDHAAEHVAMGGIGAFAVSGAAASVTGTLSKTDLATITIPAGLMGESGKLRIEAQWSFTNSANGKVLGVEFGGQKFAETTRTTEGMFEGTARIRNRSATQQRGPGATAGIAFTGAGGTGAISTFTVDTTVAQNITITGTLTNTGETITLESYSVELLK